MNEMARQAGYFLDIEYDRTNLTYYVCLGAGFSSLKKEEKQMVKYEDGFFVVYKYENDQWVQVTRRDKSVYALPDQSIESFMDELIVVYRQRLCETKKIDESLVNYTER